jgi:hypothetical protein
VVYGLRSAHSKSVAIGILAIKKTERILLKSGLTGIAKSINVRVIILHKSSSVLRSALLTSDRIYVKLHVGKTESVKHRVGKRDSGSI